jgi:hypothetical protein
MAINKTMTYFSALTSPVGLDPFLTFHLTVTIDPGDLFILLIISWYEGLKSTRKS